MSSRLRRMAEQARKEAIDALERDFLNGELSELDTRQKLTELFGNDEHFWILYDMRKHGIPYGS